MKYLKKYDDLDFYISVNEKVNISEYKNIIKKIKDDIGSNLYFISTFGMAVPALYPVIEKLAINEMPSINKEQIVLLAICAISIILKESKEDIKKLKSKIKEEGISSLLEYVTDSIENIVYIFQKIAKYFGKTLVGLTDMLSYVALCVPFTIVLIDIINNFGMTFAQLSDVISNPTGLAIATGVGIVTITLKQLITLIIKKLIRRKNK